MSRRTDTTMKILLKQDLLFGAAACSTAIILFSSTLTQAAGNTFEALPGVVEAHIYGYPLATMK